MRRILGKIGLGLFAMFYILILSGNAVALDADEVTRMKNGTVQIFVTKYFYSKSKGKVQKKQGTGSGTGFILNDQGYIATNFHVVKGYLYYNKKPAIAIALNDQIINYNDEIRKSLVEVVWTSESLDLAILKFTTEQPLKRVILAPEFPGTSDPVYAVGYPGASSDNELRSNDVKAVSTMTKGIFSHEKQGQWTGKGGTLSILQHNSEISWGNSGGPLYDDCQRVIGVNTRLTFRNGNVAPGVFFSSNISELIKILDSKGIEYEVGNDACVPEEQKIYQLIQNLVLIGGAAILLLVVILVFVLRRPRERVVQLVESYSRSFRGDAPPAPQKRNTGPRKSDPRNHDATRKALPQAIKVRLRGRLSNGAPVDMPLDDQDLMRGIILGRQPDDRRFALDDMGISRNHAVLFQQDGFVKIRDEGSTNGTRVNGRVLRPRQEQALADGDEFFLGEAKITISIR
ncbi:trypsin-like peptidase domain-containing protein [Paremcibacter congregatus]|uniref:trypsin-like peptidase domain-containing protein n=1 Tax=Paremcibacter congregatus TaxID=2043170 RepID=UPI0030EECC9E|tara:strand:+ start:4555 stop:5928 length:1374 start_codon:yes stop_codon:yes gene_type:complete